MAASGLAPRCAHRCSVPVLEMVPRPAAHGELKALSPTAAVLPSECLSCARTWELPLTRLQG